MSSLERSSEMRNFFVFVDSSKQFNTFSDYPVIVLRILILHFVCGLDLSLSFLGSFFLCAATSHLLGTMEIE